MTYILIFLIWSVSLVFLLHELSLWEFMKVCMLFRLLIWAMDGIIKEHRQENLNLFKRVSTTFFLKNVLILALFLIFIICKWIGFI